MGAIAIELTGAVMVVWIVAWAFVVFATLVPQPSQNTEEKTKPLPAALVDVTLTNQTPIKVTTADGQAVEIPKGATWSSKNIEQVATPLHKKEAAQSTATEVALKWAFLVGGGGLWVIGLFVVFTNVLEKWKSFSVRVKEKIAVHEAKIKARYGAEFDRLDLKKKHAKAIDDKPLEEEPNAL